MKIDILKIDPDFKRIQKLAHWYTIGSAYDIEVLDNMLYVANAANGMATIKIDIPFDATQPFRQ